MTYTLHFFKPFHGNLTCHNMTRCSPHHFKGSVSRAALDLPGICSQLHPTRGTVEVVWVEGVTPPPQRLPVYGGAERLSAVSFYQGKIRWVSKCLNTYNAYRMYTVDFSLQHFLVILFHFSPTTNFFFIPYSSVSNFHHKVRSLELQLNFQEWMSLPSVIQKHWGLNCLPWHITFEACNIIPNRHSVQSSISNDTVIKEFKNLHKSS